MADSIPCNVLTPSFLTSTSSKGWLSDSPRTRLYGSFPQFYTARRPAALPRASRVAVLEELFDWIVGNVQREAWIAWLNGAAGAGKSAICRSVAEVSIQRGIKVASFFFFRTGVTRNTIDPVVATLAYQIIQLFPETKELIVESIEAHPLIFEQTLATQLEVFIVTSIRGLRMSDTSVNLLLVIDGVDECAGETALTDLIRAFSTLFQQKDLALVVLFGSRRESHL